MLCAGRKLVADIKELLIDRYRSRFIKGLKLTPVPCFVHSPRAASGWASTAAGSGCGRNRAKPTRRIPYAAKMLKATEPTDAAINIVKFNASAIAPAFVCFLNLKRAAFPLSGHQKTASTRLRITDCDSRRKPAALVCFLLTNRIP